MRPLVKAVDVKHISPLTRINQLQIRLGKLQKRVRSLEKTVGSFGSECYGSCTNPIPMTANGSAYEVDIPNPPGTCNDVKSGGRWMIEPATVTMTTDVLKNLQLDWFVTNGHQLCSIYGLGMPSTQSFNFKDPNGNFYKYTAPVI